MPTADPFRRRALAAGALRAVGVMLVVLSLVFAYANRVVFNPRAFAQRSALALGDPRVASFLAERVADQAVARKPDLIAVRPVIVTAARTVIASEPFRALFQRASEKAHELAFSKATETVVLSLPDFAVLLNSAVSRMDPSVRQRLPSELGAQLGHDVDAAMGAGALRVLRAASQLRRLVLLSLIVGACLLATSVGLMPDRRRGLLLAGLALAAAAILLFALPGVLGMLVSARIEDAGLRAAARGVWGAFSGRLETWALVLGGMGLVLAAAASSFASRVEDRPLKRAWEWLHGSSGNRGSELLRSAGLLVVGLASALQPLDTLRLLALLAGAAMTFDGVRRLFALIAPRLDEPATGAQAAGDSARGAARGRRPWLRYAAAALVVLALIGSGLAWLNSAGAVPRAVLEGRCNGSPALCDLPLDKVVFPGAHNAMSAADFPGWLFPNQEVGLTGQLRHGIRALLFDVHNGVPVAGRVKTEIDDEPGSRAKFEKAVGAEGIDAAMRIRDRLVGPPEGPKAAYLCHGFCELGARPLVEALRDIRDFLIENPGEVLLIVIEDYVPPADIARDFAESGLLEYVYKGATGPPWPTLRQLVEANERVLVAAENDRGDLPWYHLAYQLTQETPYHFETATEFSCRANRGGDGKSFFLMNHWIDTTPTPKPSNAAIINQRDFILARARQCESERGKRPTILAVDFALTGDVVGAAAEMNGIGAPMLRAPEANALGPVPVSPEPGDAGTQ